MPLPLFFRARPLTLVVISVFVAAPVWAVGGADKIDTTAMAEHADAWHEAQKPVNGNPVWQFNRYTTNLSRVIVAADNWQASRPLFCQFGKGETAMNISADSYIRLSHHTTVWGSAGYATGKRRQIKWNSTADFALLYPYVMADTLGGNLTFERYAFTAGWASAWKKVKLGADMDFRAEHEYRTTDPRPRNIVTDLTMRLGVSIPLSSLYELGLTGACRFYKQTNEVKFYREAGVIPEYHMLGLGMDYKRFSGSNASTYYKGTGYEVGIDLTPIGRYGLMASAGYAYAPYHRILPNLNALPISVLGVQRVKGELGWKENRNAGGWMLKASADYERRTGNEQIAGSSSSGEYRIVDELTTYRAHSARYALTAIYNHRARQTVWNASLSTGYSDYAARYVFPERRLSFDKAFVEARGQWQRLLPRRHLLSADVAAAYYASVSSSMQMPYTTMSDANARLMEQTMASLSAGYFLAQARLRWTIPLRRNAFFVELGGRFLANNDSFHSWSQHLAIGFTF